MRLERFLDKDLSCIEITKTEDRPISEDDIPEDGVKDLSNEKFKQYP